MRTLVVGVGALGSLVAARLRGAGCSVSLATRDAASAAALRESGLHVTGVGGAVSADVADVAPLEEYGRAGGAFDLVVLATKAHDAIDAAPRLVGLLHPDGTLLPIQNGGVAQAIADRLGDGRVLGGLSNVGATLKRPGVCEQRNAGALLVGEIGGGESERAERVRGWLGRAMDVRVTHNFPGVVWAKLLLNCSVTTLGAVAGQTMREYVASPDGRTIFDRTYDEVLSVALASGARPERILVEPLPPCWSGRSIPGDAHDGWLGQIVKGYGDVKPSMLQDFERGRRTEIDFINGYAVSVGRRLGVPTPVNAAIVDTVHAITRGVLAPSPLLLGRILWASEDQGRGRTDAAGAHRR